MPQSWVSFMKENGVKRVCCLLTADEIHNFYTKPPLKELYLAEFGKENILWAGITNDSLCSREALDKLIIPFLRKSIKDDGKTVVHCRAGSGRTSVILAAFLVRVRNMDIDEALKAVSNVAGVSRRLLDGVGKDYTRTDLVSLLKIV